MDVHLQDIAFWYPNGQLGLAGCTCQAPAGQITALFGPNGSGKSTALKCTAGLLRQREGLVTFDGQDLSHSSARQRAVLCAYVPQEHIPPFPFTVEEVVLMGRTPHLRGFFGPGPVDRAKASQAMSQAGIESLSSRCYTELSGGQRQLVLLARALAQDTPVLVLDEPASALDFHNQLSLWTGLRSLCASGKTIIVTTHNPSHVLWFCHRAVILQGGRTIAEGPITTVVTREMLHRLYGPRCDILMANGIPVVVPLEANNPEPWRSESPPTKL